MPLMIDSVAALLKKETAARHQDAEDVLQAYLHSIDSIDKYAALLRMFYGYFMPLQESIARYIGPAQLEDFHERRTAGAILKDLEYLGAAKPAATCKNLPSITNMDEAFGALYVLEGSTLGGRVIAKMLSRHAGVQLDAAALHFLDGYGEATGTKWKSFIEVLNRQEGVTDMLAAANETFACLQAWIHHNLIHE